MKVNISIQTSTTIPRRLWWLLPDDMLDPPVPVNGNFPLIAFFRPEVILDFTQDMQEFVFSLNRSDDEARDRKAFQGYIDNRNTRGKIRDHRNYILGEGLDRSPSKWEAYIGCAANCVSGTPEISSGVQETGFRAGTPILRLDYIDTNKPLPYGMTNETHPHLIQHSVTIIMSQYEGINRRNPVPQMGGRSVPPFRPTFIPLMSPSPLFVEMRKLREVTTPPNPYHPAWYWKSGIVL